MPLLELKQIEFKSNDEILAALNAKEFVMKDCSSTTQMLAMINSLNVTGRDKLIGLLSYANSYLLCIEKIKPADKLYSLLILHKEFNKFPVPQNIKDAADKIKPPFNDKTIEELVRNCNEDVLTYFITKQKIDPLGYCKQVEATLFGINFPNIINKAEYKEESKALEYVLGRFRATKEIEQIFPKNATYRIREVTNKDLPLISAHKLFPIACNVDNVVCVFDLETDIKNADKTYEMNLDSITQVLKAQKLYGLEKI